MSLQNIQNLVTDLCRDNTQSILLKQYEKNSRFIIVKCTENGVFKKLDNENMTCKIKVLTPDDRAIYDSCDILDDGTVKVSVSESMVYASGIAKAELNIIDKYSTTLLATMIFNLIIKPSAYSDDRVIASDEFSALTELMTTVEQTVQTVITLEARINEEQVQWEANENERIASEQQRKTDETTRKNDETIRQQKETERQQAETLRESNFATAISNVNDAISASNEATENANTATLNANLAAKNANDTNTVAQGLVTQMKEQLQTVTQSIIDASTATENAQNSADIANAVTENMNQLKTELENAESIRVQDENARQSNEEIRQQSLSEMKEATFNANTATENANIATANANNVASQLLEDKANGLFKGEKGDQGEKGEKGDAGESGVTVPTNGFFTLSIDENGDLYCYYNDADNPPTFELDDNGDLYFVVADN